MKNILVLVHDDPGQEARLQAALDITRAVDGHLICVDVTIMLPLMSDLCDNGGEIMLLQQEQVRERANRAAIERRLAQEQIQWDWIDATGEIAPCVVAAAALSDLIVTSRKIDAIGFPDMLGAAGAILTKTDRAVLAVPETSHGIVLSGKALVCWDGSPSCIKALRAAMPLLALARSVTLYAVEDGSIAVPATDAATYLSRHGIKAVVQTQKLHRERPEALIFDAIHRHASDYVVMGGFSHGRLVEALLGGVTRAMLAASPVPVLLMH